MTRCLTGVYIIRCRVNGKMYVGGAYKSLAARIRLHRKTLRLGTHPNNHLLAAWNKYGAHNFQFIVKERCEADLCRSREQYWIDKLDVCDRSKGYNKSPTAGSPLGVRHTPETRARFSLAMYKRMESQDERMKVGAAMRGKKHTDSSRLLMSQSGKKTWADPDVRQKRLESMTGLKRDASVGEKISRALKGRRLSADHRYKAGSANRGKKQSPEVIAKRAAGIRLAWKRRKEKSNEIQTS